MCKHRRIPGSDGLKIKKRGSSRELVSLGGDRSRYYMLLIIDRFNRFKKKETLLEHHGGKLDQVLLFVISHYSFREIGQEFLDGQWAGLFSLLPLSKDGTTVRRAFYVKKCAGKEMRALCEGSFR